MINIIRAYTNNKNCVKGMVKVEKYNVYKEMINKSIMFTFFYLNNTYQFDSVITINYTWLF